MSPTLRQQAPRNEKLPTESPHHERACWTGSESCVTPGHWLNFSASSPTRLGTGWAQITLKLCPRRDLTPKILSHFFHASLEFFVVWGFNSVSAP